MLTRSHWLYFHNSWHQSHLSFRGHCSKEHVRILDSNRQLFRGKSESFKIWDSLYDRLFPRSLHARNRKPKWSGKDIYGLCGQNRGSRMCVHHSMVLLFRGRPKSTNERCTRQRYFVCKWLRRWILPSNLPNHRKWLQLESEDIPLQLRSIFAIVRHFFGQYARDEP